MMLFNRYWIALVLLFCVAAMPLRAGAASPTVIFSEIAWAGSSISSADEWIELTNLTNEPIDISGWSITGAGSSEKIIVLPEGSMIHAYSTFLITNYEYQHANTALNIEPSFVTATLSLPNNGFRLDLYDHAGAQIDVAGGDGSPFAGGSGSTAESTDGRYRSMARMDGLIAGSDKAAWADAQTSAGFKEGVQDLGTPGSVEAIPQNTTVQEAPVQDAVEQEETLDAESSLETEVPAPQTESAEPADSSQSQESQQLPEESITQEQVENPDPETPSNTQAQEAPIMYVSGVVLINEFVVDPLEEQSEWIELVNTTTQTIELAGWTLEDASGKTTDFSTMSLAPRAFAVVEAPKGQLNNDADSIVLKDAAGTIIDAISYGTESLKAPKDGNALARNQENIFELTQIPTPGAVNMFIATAPQEEEQVEPAVSEEVSEEAVSTDQNEATQTEQVQEIPVATQEETVTTESADKSYNDPMTIRFIALYPNTTGSDEAEEFIELMNVGLEPVNLKDWTIEDAGGKRYLFSASVVIDADDRLQLYRVQTKITLNNTNEILKLIAPNQQLIDQVNYTTAPKGARYELVNGMWQWSQTTVSTATRAVENNTVVQTSANASASSSSKQKAVQTISSVTIAQGKQRQDETLVRVKGSVIALPGNLGRQIFYLMDETGGIQIYFYEATFPEFSLGKQIQVTGRMSTSHGERRIKIDAQTDLLVMEDETAMFPATMELDDLGDVSVGSLILVEGMVKSKSEEKLVIENNGTQLVVYLKSTPSIDVNRFMTGDMLIITGILTRYDDELRIRPRGDEDIVTQTPVATVVSASTESNGKSVFQSTQASIGLVLFVTTIAGLGLYAVWNTWQKKQKRLSAAPL